MSECLLLTVPERSERLLVTVPEVSLIRTAGTQGSPGRDGTSVSYLHTQSIPAAIWTVAHNLGRNPLVSVTDALGALIYPDVAHVDFNSLRIAHGNPRIGAAYCI